MVSLKFLGKKSLKIANSRSFLRTTARKIQDKFEDFWQGFVGGVAF